MLDFVLDETACAPCDSMQTDFAFMTNYWRDLEIPPVTGGVAPVRDPARKASGSVVGNLCVVKGRRWRKICAHDC